MIKKVIKTYRWSPESKGYRDKITQCDFCKREIMSGENRYKSIFFAGDDRLKFFYTLGREKELQVGKKVDYSKYSHHFCSRHCKEEWIALNDLS